LTVNCEQFICDKCGERYPCKKSLKEHKRTHYIIDTCLPFKITKYGEVHTWTSLEEYEKHIEVTKKFQLDQLEKRDDHEIGRNSLNSNLSPLNISLIRQTAVATKFINPSTKQSNVATELNQSSSIITKLTGSGMVKSIPYGPLTSTASRFLSAKSMATKSTAGSKQSNMTTKSSVFDSIRSNNGVISQSKNFSYYGCVICKVVFISMEQLFQHGQRKHQTKYLAEVALL